MSIRDSMQGFTDSQVPAFAAQDVYQLGDWVLHAHANQLIRGDLVVELEHRLTNLLIYFLQSDNKVLSKDDILKTIWHKKVVNEDSVAVAISQLRKALDDNARSPTYIKTIPGVGYQFIYSPVPLVPINADDESLKETPSVKDQPVSSMTKQRRSLRAGLFALLSFIVLGGAGWYFTKLPPLGKDELPNDPSYREASELVKGWDKEKLKTAVGIFRKSLEINPNFAPAYLGIAEAKAKIWEEQIIEDEKAAELEALLAKALSLDDHLAHAHLWLAELRFAHDFNYDDADVHYKKAIELSPQDDLLHYKYGRFLFIRKRFDEAREHINKARTLNPLNFSHTSVVWLYLLQGKNDLAEKELRRIESTEEGDIFFKIAAQNVYYSSGNEQKVYQNMQWFFKKAKFSDEKIHQLDLAFARGGLVAVNQWLLDNKETSELGQYTPPMSWARYAVAAGQHQAALDYLEQAFKLRQAHVECAASDPRFAPLLTDERFKNLINKFTPTEKIDKDTNSAYIKK